MKKLHTDGETFMIKDVFAVASEKIRSGTLRSYRKGARASEGRKI